MIPFFDVMRNSMMRILYKIKTALFDKVRCRKGYCRRNLKGKLNPFHDFVSNARSQSRLINLSTKRNPKYHSTELKLIF